MSKIEIKALDDGKMEARGFLLQTGSDEWILYPEPSLKSCCHAGDLKMGLPLTGSIPTRCKGQCLTLQGTLQANVFEVSSSAETSFPFGLSALLLILFLLAFFSKYLFRSKPPIIITG